MNGSFGTGGNLPMTLCVSESHLAVSNFKMKTDFQGIFKFLETVLPSDAFLSAIYLTATGWMVCQLLISACSYHTIPFRLDALSFSMQYPITWVDPDAGQGY